MMKSFVILMAAICLITAVGNASPSDYRFGPGTGNLSPERTIFDLKVDAVNNAFADVSEKLRSEVSGGEVARDPTVGPYFRFGSGAGNRIIVYDGGSISFNDGFTLESWIYSEKGDDLDTGGILAIKQGSFCFTLKDRKLNNAWMAFPKEKVATDALFQYNEYPVDNQAFFGATPIPVGRWVHLAITYDPSLKVVRTWIDGGLDRTRYLPGEGQAPLLNDPSKPIEFLRDLKNIRVAGLRLSKGVLPIGPVPTMEAYVHQLPGVNKIAVVFDHIDKTLPFPVDVSLTWESPGGATRLAESQTIGTPERRVVMIDAPDWKGALHTLAIKAYSRNQLLYSRSVRVANPVGGKRIVVNKDKSVALDGKKSFPLFIYHAFPEDYGLLAGMGFNIIVPRGLGLRFMGTGGSDERTLADLKTCLDEAAKQGVSLIVEGNTVFNNLNRVPLFKDHSALLAWVGFDEPWGTIERFQESYNILKLLDPGRPIYGTQNNASRYAETAEAVDILAPNSYPVPKVSLRDVSFRTVAAVNAVAGLKPVWTILGQYENSRPSLRELRCMAWLAIISGANGLGFYAWDDRKDKVSGWYTKDHADDVSTLRKVVQELKGLEPILMQPNVAQKVGFTPSHSALHAAVKDVGGKKYLFVANDSREAEEGVLIIEGVSEATAVCLSAERDCKPVRFREGRATLRLAPLEVGLYEMNVLK